MTWIKHYTSLCASALLSVLMAAFLSNADEQVKCPSVHEKAVAIFIAPTDDKIESMKKEEGEEDYYVIADDELYYQ